MSWIVLHSCLFYLKILFLKFSINGTAINLLLILNLAFLIFDQAEYGFSFLLNVFPNKFDHYAIS